MGRAPAVLAPRDGSWRSIAPGFEQVREMATSGLPVQIAAERRYDRAPGRRRIQRALARGETVLMPQAHQVLPRVARLMVALRALVLGPFREECSFLFLVEGRGREGMGLHHDGPVDSFWLQLAGRRTVTIGPRVAPGTSADLEVPGRARGWTTFDLPPGSLFYLPPWMPHRVVCRARSLALSLTWSPPARQPRRWAPRVRSSEPGPGGHGRGLDGSPHARAESLASWVVTDGRVTERPRRSRTWLWTQVPAVASPPASPDTARLWTVDGAVDLDAPVGRLATTLAAMPMLRRRGVRERLLASLVALGILGDEDLPLRILPTDVASLDGWRFA